MGGYRTRFNHITNIENKTQTNRSRRPCNTTQTKPTASATARASKKHHATKQTHTPTQNKPHHPKHSTVQKKQTRTTRRATILSLVRTTHSNNSRSLNRRRQMATKHPRPQRHGQPRRSMQTLQQFTRCKIQKHKTFTKKHCTPKKRNNQHKFR
jgi:hypothetical protein